MPRYKTIMNFEGAKSPMFVVRLYVWMCFVYLQVYGVWSLQWTFWVGFGDGMGLLLQLGWLLNEEWGSCSCKLIGARDWMEANESW
jgi:hypothetical protein